MIPIPTDIIMGAEWLCDAPRVNGFAPGNFGPVVEVVTLPRQPQQDRFAVEWLFAEVHPRHLGQGSPTNQRARNWVQTVVGRTNDDAGHIIGRNQGGSGTDLWNLFPQNGNFNRGVYASSVERNINDATNYGGVRMWFRFVFDKPEEPFRATSFNYYIEYPNGMKQCNDLLNP